MNHLMNQSFGDYDYVCMYVYIYILSQLDITPNNHQLPSENPTLLLNIAQSSTKMIEETWNGIG